jgi:hypothetical protein
MKSDYISPRPPSSRAATFRLVGALAALSALSSPASAQTASLTLTGLDGQAATLATSDIAALPHETVTLQLDAKTETCEGVPLSVLLAKVGAPQGKALRGPEMADMVVVSAADGYRVAIALAETDPLMRANEIVLADRCAGAPLGPQEGPFRIVVEGDKRPARAARQVTAITLLRPFAASAPSRPE